MLIGGNVCMLKKNDVATITDIIARTCSKHSLLRQHIRERKNTWESSIYAIAIKPLVNVARKQCRASFLLSFFFFVLTHYVLIFYTTTIPTAACSSMCEKRIESSYSKDYSLSSFFFCCAFSP